MTGILRKRIVLVILLALAVVAPANAQEDVERSVSVYMRTIRNKKASLDYRRRACNELATLGPKAAPAVAALVDVLADEDLGCWAACALKAIAPEGTAAVRKLLDTTDKAQIRLRLTARLALGKRELYDELFALLQDSDLATRCWAVDTLTRLGEAVPARATVIARRLEQVSRQDKTPEIRSRAAFALARMPPRGEGVVEAVTRVLIDRQARPAQRVRAAQLLGRLGRKAEYAEPALRAALSAPDPVLRRAAAASLGQVGAGSEATVQALLDAAVTAAAMGDAECYERARKASDTLIIRIRNAKLRQELEKLARKQAARAADYRARADRARAWAEANRARVEREIAAGQQWLSEAKARTDRLVIGCCYDRQAHLDDAAYYAAAAASCQASAAYWSKLGNSESATQYSQSATEYDAWANYHRDTARRLAP
jgi:hypothetical protein